MKEFGPPGGRASLAPPLDPPMVSVKFDYPYSAKFLFSSFFVEKNLFFVVVGKKSKLGSDKWELILSVFGYMTKYRSRLWAVFVSCVLCLCSVFCIMLGANTMLGVSST